MDYHLALSKHCCVLLCEYTFRAMLQYIRSNAEATHLKRFKLSVQLLHLVQANLHTNKASDVALLGLLMTFLSQHADEICELFCQRAKYFMQSFIE